MSRAQFRRFLRQIIPVAAAAAGLFIWAGALPPHDSLRRPLTLLSICWCVMGIIICILGLASTYRAWKLRRWPR